MFKPSRYFDPQKIKYHELYWSIAEKAAQQSVANRHKVGAVFVTSSGMLSLGWNGMPSGLSNDCESSYIRCDEHPDGIRAKTNPEVIHAEQNALDKMARQGLAVEGSILFVTRAPCMECAKKLHNLGLKAIVYAESHDDMSGVELLKKVGVPIYHKSMMTPQIYYSLN